MNRHKILLLLTICVLLVPAAVSAADIGSFVLSPRQLTAADGLSDNTVYDIAEDADGFIWMGAAYGLCRYDGYRFLCHYTFSPDGRSRGDATTGNIYEDRARRLLWVQSSTFAFACYDLRLGRFIDYTGRDSCQTPYRRHLLTAKAMWMYDNHNGIRRTARQGFRLQCRDYAEGSGLPSSNVGRMAEDAQGNAWAATRRGLVRIDTDGTPATIAADRQYMEVAAWRGNIVALAAGGLIELYAPSGKRLRQTVVPQTTAKLRTVRGQMVWQDKWMLLCPKSWAFDLRTWRIAPFDDDLHDGLVLNAIDGNFFVSNSSGRLWVFPKKGEVQRLDLLPDIRFTADRKRRHTVCRTSDGTFFIATYGGGLYAWDMPTGRLVRYSAADPQPVVRTNYLTNIYADSHDRLWIAQDASGVALVNITRERLAKFVPLTKGEQGDWGNYVGALMRGYDGEIVASTRANTLYRLDPATGAPSLIATTPATVAGMATDHSGNRWMATQGWGLYINGIQFNKGDANHAGPSRDYTGLALDSRGRTWLATREEGLVVATYSPSAGLEYRRLMGRELNEGRVWAIALDATGRLWAATSAGLYSIDTRAPRPDDSQLRHYSPADGTFPFSEVRCIAVRSGQLWAGGKGGGLVRCQLNKAGRIVRTDIITDDEGLASSTINSICPDRYGQVWASTPAGLSRIYDKDMKVQTYRFRLRPEANIYSSASMALPDGRLLFGTRAGLTIITPTPPEPKAARAEPKVLITEVEINGRPVATPPDSAVHLLSELRLAYRENTISLAFSNLDYGEDDASLYQYRLDGVDDDWRPKTRLAHTEYANLAPGSYTFRVRTLFGGVWSKEATLRIVIAQPWYNTWWAWLIYIICVAAAMLYVWHGAKQRLRLHEQIRLDRRMMEFRIAFFTNIAHEFRTPLAIIQAAVERLQGDDARQMKQAQQSALRGTKRLGRLIGQLMEFRRINTGNIRLSPANADIVAFCRRVHQDFWPAAKQKDLSFTFTPFAAAFTTAFDKRMLENMVYNLVSNAIKYTPAKGSVAVRLRKQGDTLYIEVEDDGPGISPDRQAAMFRPFMGGNVSQGGMGIGLYLAHTMAKLHGGSLHYRQAGPDGGALFTIALPTNLAPAADNPDNPDTAAAPEAAPEALDLAPEPLNDIRIAIIEDDADMALEISTELGRYFQTRCYPDGTTALHAIARDNPALVVCDMLLPDMRGTEIVARLRADSATARLPIIMLTALDDEANQLRSYNAGADDYMVKPCNFRLLVARMAQLIKERRSDSKPEPPATAPGTPAPVATTAGQGQPTIITTTADRKLLDRIEALVHQHIADPAYTIDQLAADLGLGRTKAYNKVRELTGMSPGKYFMAQRMELAADLLRDGTLTVAEVSYRVGIADASYFNKCFKAKYGVTPSKYK